MHKLEVLLLNFSSFRPCRIVDCNLHTSSTIPQTSKLHIIIGTSLKWKINSIIYQRIALTKTK